MKKTIQITILCLSFSIFSCQSIKKSYESRDYDKTVAQFTDKKKKESDEEIDMFEKA